MSRIVATGSYVPEQVLTNEALIELTQIDSNDEWIRQRTGIEKRHWASKEEGVAEIAVKAAKDILSKVDSDVLQKIELVIVASMSSYLPTPSLAHHVIGALNIEGAWGFDVSGACNGFVLALETANALSSNRSSGYTLVIGAEKMSQILDHSDRSTVILFGDGAGGVLIKNDGHALPEFVSQQYASMDKDDSIVVTEHQSEKLPYMTMKGREVFNFVTRSVIPSLKSFINDHHLDFDYLIAHQANQRLLDLIGRKLSLTNEAVPSNIAEVANLSAGSIPVLLDHLVEEGCIKLDGQQKVVLSGYGGGLAWGHLAFKI